MRTHMTSYFAHAAGISEQQASRTRQQPLILWLLLFASAPGVKTACEHVAVCEFSNAGPSKTFTMLQMAEVL